MGFRIFFDLSQYEYHLPTQVGRVTVADSESELPRSADVALVSSLVYKTLAHAMFDGSVFSRSNGTDTNTHACNQ